MVGSQARHHDAGRSIQEMKKRQTIGCSAIAAAVVLFAVVFLLRELVTERSHRIHRFRPADDIVVDVFHGDFADPTFNFRWSVRSHGEEVLSRQTFFMTHDMPTQRFAIVRSPDFSLVALAGTNQTVLYAICDLTTGRKWISADLGSDTDLLSRINQSSERQYTLWKRTYPWDKERRESNQQIHPIAGKPGSG
jgi:hypothetical protein